MIKAYFPLLLMILCQVTLSYAGNPDGFIKIPAGIVEKFPSEDNPENHEIKLNRKTIYKTDNDYSDIEKIFKYPNLTLFVIRNGCMGSSCSQLDLTFLTVYNSGKVRTENIYEDYGIRDNSIKQLDDIIVVQSKISSDVSLVALYKDGKLDVTKFISSDIKFTKNECDDLYYAYKSFSKYREFTSGRVSDPLNDMNIGMASYRTIKYYRKDHRLNTALFRKLCHEADQLQKAITYSSFENKICK